ncbi:ATP-binding protein [Spirillospora sp. CA-253888]
MTLPRDAGSAPLARHTLDASLRGLGVGADDRADIGLALGEACANVIQHARASREYEVKVRLDRKRCEVDVIDGGHDTDPTATWHGEGSLNAEHGRGLHLIGAFTEDLYIQDRPHNNGAIVHFAKTLAG